MSDGETWLVTGAAGFLGRHVLTALAESPAIDRVVTLDRRRPAVEGGLVADLAEEPPDLGKLFGLGSAFGPGPGLGAGRTIDVVVHLAGLAHRDGLAHRAHRAGDAVLHRRSHVHGMQNLLTALDELGERPRAVLFASSVAVYGRDSGGLLTEETPLAPTTDYGAAKADAESLLTGWAARRNVTASVLRLPLLVGREAPGNLGRMIRALERHRYVGVGPGSARRSMVLAEDVARLLPRASRQAGTFHLTDRRHPSFRELEQVVCRVLGRALPPRMPLSLARPLARLGDLAGRVSEPLLDRPAPFTGETLRRMTSTLTFNDDRAVRRLGWSPRPVLEEAERWVGASTS